LGQPMGSPPAADQSGGQSLIQEEFSTEL